MTRIQHTTFDGQIPRLEPSLLPENAAQTADNVDLRRGVLSPVPVHGNDLEERPSAATVGFIQITCRAAGSTTVAAWKAIVQPVLSVVYNSGLSTGDQSDVAWVYPNFAAAATMADIAATLQAGLRAAGALDHSQDTIAWDATAGRFVLRFLAGTVSIQLAALTGYVSLASASWMGAYSSTGTAQPAVPDGVSTIHLWRGTSRGSTGGSVTMGVLAETDWTVWAALESTAGFAIRLNETTYQVRPQFAADATTQAAIQDAITYALRSATRDTSMRFVFSVDSGADPDEWYGLFFTPGRKLVSIETPDDPTLEDLSGADWLNVTVVDPTELPEEPFERWLGWLTRVNVVESPVNDDYYSRLYYTGDGLPKVRYLRDGTEYVQDLAIEQPATAPTVAGTPVEEPADPEALGTRPPADVFAITRWGIVIAADGKEVARLPATYDEDYVFVGLASDTLTVQESTVTVNVRKRDPEITWTPYATINTTIVSDAAGNNPLLKLGWNATVYGVNLRVDIEEVAGAPKMREVTFGGHIRVGYRKADDEGLSGEPDDPIEEAVFPSYCCAFVTALGEEGPLGPASFATAMLGTDPVALSDIPQPADAAARGITHIRLYRSAGGSFWWLQDVPVGETTFSDGFAGDDAVLGEEAPDYGVNPPDDLAGLITTPNGFFAAFHDREVCLSEPWLPYAWPEGYRLTVPHDIVALAAVGNDVVVLTAGRPVILSGTAPEAMTAAVLEVDQACVSAGSVALLGNMVVYASPDGLVGIYAGQAQMLTREFYRRTEWQALTPSLIQAAVHDGRYVASFGDRMLIFDAGSEGMDRVTMATGAYRATFSDLETDTLYVVLYNAVVAAWTADTDLALPTQLLTWRGREWRYPRPVSFGAARVVAESYTAPGTGETDQRPLLTLYADGVSVATARVSSGGAFRLPMLRPAKRWSVQVTSYVEVREIVLATSVGALLA